MIRSHVLASAALAAALGAAACASSGDNDAADTAPAASSAPAASAAPATTTSGYTDAQLRAFIAVSREVGALTPGTTAEAQAAYAQQASEILTRNNLDATTYNAIGTAARTDRALSERIASLRVENVTDAMLRRFIDAATEINPIASSITAESTDAQRQQASDQIGAILQRHQIDSATYNAIAQRAQTAAALAGRITALQSTSQPTAPSPQ